MKLTHCPHCGKELLDQRLDDDGYPKPGTEWELSHSGGPVTKLTVSDIHKADRLGREILGTIEYRTKQKGTEYDNENRSAAYSTDYETFHKTWSYTGKKDQDAITKMQLEVGDGG